MAFVRLLSPLLASDCAGTYQGCFLDAAPAPGVPPVRVVDKLVAGPVAKMTVPQCSSLCSAEGFLFAGLTGGPHGAAGEELFCYCGCALNNAAPVEDASKCNSACVPPGAQHCGGNGVMSAFKVSCSPVPPPSVTCGNGTVLAVTDGGSVYSWGQLPSPQRLDALSTPQVRVQMVACAKGVVEEEDGAPLVLTLAAPEAPSAFSEQFDRYYRTEASHQAWQQSAPLL